MTKEKSPSSDGNLAIEIKSSNSLAHDAYQNLMLDMQLTNAQRTDYGVNSEQHYTYLRDAVRKGGISLIKFIEILGDGPAITQAVAESLPQYSPIVYRTIWDEIEGRV